MRDVVLRDCSQVTLPVCNGLKGAVILLLCNNVQDKIKKHIPLLSSTDTPTPTL